MSTVIFTKKLIMIRLTSCVIAFKLKDSYFSYKSFDLIFISVRAGKGWKNSSSPILIFNLLLIMLRFHTNSCFSCWADAWDDSGSICIMFCRRFFCDWLPHPGPRSRACITEHAQMAERCVDANSPNHHPNRRGPNLPQTRRTGSRFAAMLRIGCKIFSHVYAIQNLFQAESKPF